MSSTPNLWLRTRADHNARYFHQLYAQLHAGIGLSLALSNMSEQGTNAALRQASLEMSRHVTDGRPWSEGMKKYPGLFSEMTISIIRAAEKAGFFEKACRILAEDAEREYEIHQYIKRETNYSKLLLFISTVLLPLPILIRFGPVNITLEMIHQVLIIAAIWLPWQIANYLWPLGANSEGRHKLDSIRLKMPIVGKVVRGFAMAKFCRFLAMSYAAGVDLPSAVNMAAAASGNVVIRTNLQAAVPLLRQGKTLSEVLVATGELPKTTIPLLKSGEITGDFETQLQAAARFLESDAEVALRQSVVASCILFFLIVALKIGTQVIQYHMRSHGLL
jgi:type II secretory pathway component PulF